MKETILYLEIAKKNMQVKMKETICAQSRWKFYQFIDLPLKGVKLYLSSMYVHVNIVLLNCHVSTKQESN